jgi:transcriptional regulator with XRE-family HTH domain
VEEELAVARNVALQREWYGESLSDRVRRLVVAYDVSEAQLAEVLGLSAPMLSQLMSGRRAKIGNPAVLARIMMLERRILTPEVASGDPAAIRAALEQVRDSRPTVSRDALPVEEDRNEVLGAVLRQQQRVSEIEKEVRELRRRVEERDDEIGLLRTELNLLSQLFLEIALTIPDDGTDTRSGVRVIPLTYYTSSDDQEVATELEGAISAIVEASGFISIWTGSRESGSIFRRFFASSKKALTSDEAKEAVTKIARAAELQILDVPQSRADLALAEGVSKLLTSLDKSDTAFVQLGSLVVLKVDCTPIVFNLSQLELSAINKEPSLFRDPSALLEKLRGLRTNADGAARVSIESPPQA